MTQYTNPQTFTILAWFKTSATGSIIGFSNNQSAPTSATNFDRMLWIDPTGNLVWATYGTEITSSGTYANGAWHFVAVAVGGAGRQLCVDGALAGSSGWDAQGYNGWWSIGVSGVKNNTYWGDPPSSAYFNGSLAQIAIIPSQLNSTQVSNLHGDSTLASYTSAVNALSPTNYWAHNDTGATPYLGAVPGLSGSSSTVVDASGNANTGTIEGTVTLAALGPTSLDGNAISLPGTTGSLVNTTTQYTDPNNTNGTLSQSIWFKTTTPGPLMGFTSQQTDSPSPASYDRMLWIAPSGQLAYGIYSPDVTGGFSEIMSSSTYNNGAWHLAVATVGSTGQILYVDGVNVASAAAAQNADSCTGYWHLGYAAFTYWGNAPSSNYFNGSLAYAAVYPSALTASQVLSLYRATSSASEASLVLGLSPTSYWPLTDTSPSSACALAQITVQLARGGTTSCLSPAGSGACPAPSSSVLASTFVEGILLGAMPPPSASPETITTSMAVSSGLPAVASGLRIIVPFTFYERVSTFNAQLSYPLGVVIL